MKMKLTNENIEKVHNLVSNDETYGKEIMLITSCLKKYPLNNDPDIVAMKIGLIDVTNSTHISQHKNKISVVELANIIANIKDIDKRIEEGDYSVVNEIAKSNGKINLFSFASKYCCYHNCNLYGKDDYSIFDTILKKHLPDYFKDITSNKLETWRRNCDYKSYNDYILKKLDESGINVKNKRRKFDHFIWWLNRK